MSIQNDHTRGEYISELYRKYRLGKITAEQMLERQRDVMPVCDFCHSQPSVASTSNGFICAACYLAPFKDTPHV
jgi:hypothetical protein